MTHNSTVTRKHLAVLVILLFTLLAAGCFPTAETSPLQSLSEGENTHSENPESAEPDGYAPSMDPSAIRFVRSESEALVRSHLEQDRGELTIQDLDGLNVGDSPAFCALEDLILPDTGQWFSEASLDASFGPPAQTVLEKRGYLRDPLGWFDLNTLSYSGIDVRLIRPLHPTTGEPAGPFRFKSLQVTKPGIPGPRNVSVGDALEDVLHAFPVSYQDPDIEWTRGWLETENHLIRQITYMDHVPDGPFEEMGFGPHHFILIIAFSDDVVDRVEIRHVLYAL